MAEIELRDRSGEVVARTIVDDDLGWIAAVPWCVRAAGSRPYVARRNQSGKPRWIHLHRVVLGLAPDDPRRVDHINGDTLDNRRANLRIASTAENAQNQGSRGGSSRYRGVTWDRSRGKWLANAQINGRKKTIGRFATEEEAHAAVVAWRRDSMPYAREAA